MTGTEDPRHVSRDHIELRFCYDCPRPHAENCPTCFGFGLKSGGGIVTAGKAFADEAIEGWVACSVCGGGPPVGPSPLLAVVDEIAAGEEIQEHLQTTLRRGTTSRRP